MASSLPNAPYADRSLLAGGAAGVVTTLLIWAAKKFIGWELDPTLAGSIVVFVFGLVATIIPPSVKDIIQRVDDTVIEVARVSQDSPASRVQPPAMTPETKVAVAEEIAKQ